MTELVTIQRYKPALPLLQEDTVRCRACSLHTCRNNVVFGSGDHFAKLMIVGEGPGEEEDKLGLPFVGASGRKLSVMILRIGMKRSDVYIANAVKCRPPKNRKPTREEVDACRPHLLKQITLVQPKIIVALGASAVQALFPSEKLGITKLRGKWREFNGIDVLPTFHPAYVLRVPAVKETVFQDMQLVAEKLRLVAPDAIQSALDGQA